MLRPDAARRMRVIRRAVAFVCGVAFAASAVFAQSSGDPRRGAAKAVSCGSCHGSPERPPLAGMPSLAGQQEQFLVLQIFLLREGLREVPQMAGMFNGLSDPDLTDMAAHFASQAPPSSGNASRDPELHTRGAGLSKAMGCGSCHLNDYRGQKQVPRIANQREDYLALSMKAYRDNQRAGADTSMTAVLYKVTDSEIEALAHYLAHQ
jgi:cytochrome c553